MNSKTRILLVEDQTEVLTVWAESLEREGFEVLTATTGTQGLTLVRERHPDLVLLDVVLPDLDGLEVCRQIKTDPALVRVFVILISGWKTDGESLIAGLEVGADEYLAKPIQLRELLARVRTLSRIQKTEDALRRAYDLLEARIRERTAELEKANAALRAQMAERQEAEEKLRESEARLRSIVETANEAIITMDSHGQIVSWNPGARRIFGHEASEVVGQNLTILIPERFRARHTAGLRRQVTTGQTELVGSTVQFIGTRKGGVEFPIELSLTTWQVGGHPFFTGMVRDITERKRAEQDLQESERRFASFMNNTPVLAWMKDENLRYVYINTAFAHFHRVSLKTIRGMDNFKLFPRDIARKIRGHDRAALQAGKLLQTYESVPAPDGGSHHWQVFRFPFKDVAGRQYVGGMALDITERQRAEEALRALPRRILEAQEAERRRVSRELHDSVNQLLSSVRFRVQAVAERLVDRDKGAWKDTMKVRLLLEKALNEVRRISHNLRPSELDDLGLPATIRNLCAEFKVRTDVAPNLKCAPLAARLPAEVELAIYRIIQESLSNVERHAAATRVTVRLERAGRFARITVKDNGKGFDFQSLLAKKGKKSGFGLLNMQERASSLGGKLSVKSAARKGTEILASIPLPS